MRAFAITLIALVANLVPLPKANAAIHPVLACTRTGHSGRVITYEILDNEYSYTVRKLVDNQEVAHLALRHYQAVVGYGGAHIFLENAGRSGYLLIYNNSGRDVDTARGGSLSLVDINFFQPSARRLNTHGPQTDFRCR